MRHRLTRLSLLVRADLRLLLASPWYYFILVICASIVCSFTLIQPRDDLSRIVVIDELDSTVSRHLIRELSRFGYALEVQALEPPSSAAAFDAARVRMRLDQVYAVVLIREKHDVIYSLASYLAEDVVRYSLEIVLRQYEYEAHVRRLRDADRPQMQLPIDENPLLESVQDGHDQVGVTIISGIWYLSGIVALILWILSKESLAKLSRVYSFGEILAARVLAGTFLGTFMVIVFFTTAILLGVHFQSASGLVATSLVSVVTGVLSGLMLGAASLYVGGSVFSLMMVGLLGITLLFILLTIISGMFIPIGGLPLAIQVIARTTPVFALIELLRWTALGGESLTTISSVRLLTDLAVINTIQFAVSLVLFRRVRF